MNLSRITLLLVVLNTLVVIGSSAFTYFNMQALQAGQPMLALPGTGSSSAQKSTEYRFHPVEKIIVSLQGEVREHYFVIDLLLQTELSTDQAKLDLITPAVRNSVVARLSSMSFDNLRAMSIPAMQSILTQAVNDDFAAKNMTKPFSDVLVSKLIVQ